MFQYTCDFVIIDGESYKKSLVIEALTKFRSNVLEKIKDNEENIIDAYRNGYYVSKQDMYYVIKDSNRDILKIANEFSLKEIVQEYVSLQKFKEIFGPILLPILEKN